MSCAKTAEPINMPFGMWTRVDQRNHVLDGGAHWQIRLNHTCGGDVAFLLYYFDRLLFIIPSRHLTFLLLQVFVAGASIPYPINYVINVSVILAFIIVILTIASYRFYKSREARARRRLLTGRQCLSLNMEGVRGRYPPKRIKHLIEQNERKRQREAEAAAAEYLIDRTEAWDHIGGAVQEPELRTGEHRKSGVADKPPSAGDRSAKVPALLRHITEDDPGSSPETAPAEAKIEPVLPTFVLLAEQNVNVAEGDPDAPEGNGFAVPAVVLASETSIGQSQNNAADVYEDKQSFPPEVASATKSTAGTQTAPEDNVDAELNVSSQEGSFDDSVMGD